MNNYNIMEYKHNILKNINILICKYYNNNLEMKKILKNLKEFKINNNESKFIKQLQEHIFLLNYNKDVLIKNIKLFVEFINKIEMLNNQNLEEEETDEDEILINEEEDDEYNVKNIINGIQNLFKDEEEKNNFFSFIENKYKNDETTINNTKKSFNTLLNKTEFNVVSFFTEKPTINNNLIDASDEVEMNIDNEEINTIENILGEPTHNPTNDTTKESAQNENQQNKINIEEKRKLYNQKRRERRFLKKIQT
jgi:hypothetical protein